MPIELNHTIVHAKNAEASATYYADILGLPSPVRFYHFHVIKTANGVSLDFLSTESEIIPQHYAFLVTESEFDEIFGRIQKKNLPYWATPDRSKPNQINHHDGGRGVYFTDPDNHYLEIITRPYSSVS